METSEELRGEETETSAHAPTSQDFPLFRPNHTQDSISHSFDNIPTYLFRVHAPSSVATTTTTEVTSFAREQVDSNQDLLELKASEAANRLNSHLWWHPMDQNECNLVSWSSSLLFALQYGLYRHKYDHSNPSLSDICLLMLDTRQFPRGAFIRDLEVIEEFHTHSEGLETIKEWRTSDKYFGEYLTQGHLNIDGHCSQTSIEQLIGMGLFTFCPMLERRDDYCRWANLVVKIRRDFQTRTIDTDKKEVRTAIAMAQACFGDRWAFPFATMLLSLRHRRHNDETILDGFRSMFTDEEFESLDLGGLKFGAEYDRMVELKQYQETVKAIYDRVRGD